MPQTTESLQQSVIFKATVASSSLHVFQESMRVTLITSNVGSLFESNQKLHDPWIETIVKNIYATSPDFVVINTQETGGKECVVHRTVDNVFSALNIAAIRWSPC